MNNTDQSAGGKKKEEEAYKSDIDSARWLSQIDPAIGAQLKAEWIRCDYEIMEKTQMDALLDEKTHAGITYACTMRVNPDYP